MDLRKREKVLFVLALLFLIILGIWKGKGSQITWLPQTSEEKEVVEASQTMDYGGREISVVTTQESSNEVAASNAGSPESEILPTQGEPDEIVLYVDGAVQNPGLITLEEGQRIQDAIEAAGGLREDADLSGINPAQYVADEMKITVPVKGEISQTITTVLVGGDAFVAPEKSSSEGEPPGLVDINSANAEELQTLPGIGEAKAQAIIAYRETTPFETPDQLMQVSGIGEKIYERLKGRIVIGGR